MLPKEMQVLMQSVSHDLTGYSGAVLKAQSHLRAGWSMTGAIMASVRSQNPAAFINSNRLEPRCLLLGAGI